jgi:hypothetical protein
MGMDKKAGTSKKTGPPLYFMIGVILMVVPLSGQKEWNIYNWYALAIGLVLFIADNGLVAIKQRTEKATAFATNRANWLSAVVLGALAASALALLLIGGTLNGVEIVMFAIGMGALIMSAQKSLKQIKESRDVK